MRKLWVGISIVLIVALALILIVLRTRTEPREIVIGAVLPLTGDSAFYGESIRKAVDLGVEEINAKGGIKGRKLVVVYEDSEALPADGVSAFNKLITAHKVPVVIGDAVSSVTLALAPIANKNKVVVLSPLSSAPEITDAGDFIFRNVPSDLFGGRVAAHFAVEQERWRSLAVLFVNTDFGVGLTKVFGEEVTKLGGAVVAREAYEQGSTDFRTQLVKIRSTNPDAIFLVGYREAPLILIQAKELGIQAKFLGTGLLEDPKTLELAKEAAEGVYFTQLQYSADSLEPATKIFVEMFRDKYSAEPNIIAAYGYDAIKVLAFAMEKSSLTAESIRDALYEVKDFQGVTGRISFDKNGDVEQPMGVKVIERGRFLWYKHDVPLD